MIITNSGKKAIYLVCKIKKAFTNKQKLELSTRDQEKVEWEGILKCHTENKETNRRRMENGKWCSATSKGREFFLKENYCKNNYRNGSWLDYKGSLILELSKCNSV